MRVKVFTTIENDVFKVLLETDQFTDTEQKKMEEFGQPEINVGGVYLATTVNEYTIPNKYVRIRQDFPYTQNFDSRDAAFSTNTAIKSNAWKTAVLTRLDDAIVTLLAENADFVNEEVHIYP